MSSLVGYLVAELASSLGLLALFTRSTDTCVLNFVNRGVARFACVTKRVASLCDRRLRLRFLLSIEAACSSLVELRVAAIPRVQVLLLDTIVLVCRITWSRAQARDKSNTVLCSQHRMNSSLLLVGCLFRVRCGTLIKAGEIGH